MSETKKERSVSRTLVGMPFGMGVLALYAAIVLIAQTLTPWGASDWWNGWAMLFTGVGAVLLIGAPIAVHAREGKQAVADAGIGSVALVFGLALFAFPWIWTIVLVVLAVALVVASIVAFAMAAMTHRAGGTGFDCATMTGGRESWF